MDSSTLFLVTFVVIWITWFQFLRRRPKLPPGPYAFPIIGNILQLGNLPHKSLAQLSKTYGPIISLRLGRIYTVVVSSPEISREILQKNGQAFSSRIIPAAAHAHDHYKISVTYLPVGNQWKKLRKLSQEEMFTVARLKASEMLRQEKIHELYDYMQKCSDGGRSVNIGEATFNTSLNLMSATLFSTRVTDFDSGTTYEFMKIFENLTNVVGVPNLADFFPVLKPFDPQGIQKRAKFFFGKLLGYIENLINQRLQERSKSEKRKNDLLETLLDLMEGSEYDIGIEDIKHLLLDLLVAGSETTSTTVEWAMTELLLCPKKLSKITNELRTVIGENEKLQESDISRLPYFQAVVKEIFRLHPAGPLLFPRKTDYDVEVGGYMVPKGSQVLINVWAMARESKIWENAESFEPERFLESKVDFKGQYYELIPFGSGKRICPALPLANRIVNLALATLIHKFDWKLEGGASDEEHKAELFGLSLRKAIPLMATPTKCQS